jgi:hypothetical protein
MTIITVCSSSFCIVGYALLRVIHGIQSKNLFRNPDWYIKWLAKTDRPAWCSDLRIPLLSHFCGNPPPPQEWNMIGDEYGGDL